MSSNIFGHTLITAAFSKQYSAIYEMNRTDDWTNRVEKALVESGIVSNPSYLEVEDSLNASFLLTLRKIQQQFFTCSGNNLKVLRQSFRTCPCHSNP